MSKEYIELQTYIDAIITAAKLLGYQTSTRSSTTTIYRVFGNSGITSIHMRITLYAKEDKILFATKHNHSKDLSTQSHENKINHLQTLLEAL